LTLANNTLEIDMYSAVEFENDKAKSIMA